MDGSPKLLIVDDEIQIRRIVRLTLQSHGFEIIEAAGGKEGVYKAATMHPDVIVLDLGLPDLDGIRVLKDIREWSDVPIIILSVRDEEKEKVAAFESGADDYVTKPFGVDELIARIRVALRHARRPEAEPREFRNGPLHVDIVNRIVTIDNTRIKLTATEYSLLMLFVKNNGKVLTHRYLINELWGPFIAEGAARLRVHMAQLRKKISGSSRESRTIVTEPGVGYRMIMVEER